MIHGCFSELYLLCFATSITVQNKFIKNHAWNQQVHKTVHFLVDSKRFMHDSWFLLGSDWFLLGSVWFRSVLVLQNAIQICCCMKACMVQLPMRHMKINILHYQNITKKGSESLEFAYKSLSNKVGESFSRNINLTQALCNIDFLCNEKGWCYEILHTLQLTME